MTLFLPQSAVKCLVACNDKNKERKKKKKGVYKCKIESDLSEGRINSV